MVVIDLLKVFKTGTISGVTPGMTRRQVRRILGKPDGWFNDNSERSVLNRAALWNYGGISLEFTYPCIGIEDILGSFYFKPSELGINLPWNWRGKKVGKKHYSKIVICEDGDRVPGIWGDSRVKLRSRLHRWIFRAKEAPTIQKLLAGLSRQSVSYQDSGLEMINRTGFAP